MSDKRSRNRFSLQTKYKIVTLVENKVPNNEIISQFSDQKVTTRNINDFVKQKSKIISEYEGSMSSKVKSMRKGLYPLLDDALVKFISNSVANGLPINTDLIQAKALELAPTFGYNNFSASNGYVFRFKERNDVIFKTIHGESGGVSDDLCTDWVDTKLPRLLDGYSPKDIFNGDEFGLFWRLPPNKSFIIKGQTFKNGKKSKERISVFVCANSLGTEKLKPIAIGKSREPRCFRGKYGLPVVYKNSENAWMTSEIFEVFYYL
jgi:hypothetical protein